MRQNGQTVPHGLLSVSGVSTVYYSAKNHLSSSAYGGEVIVRTVSISAHGAHLVLLTTLTDVL